MCHYLDGSSSRQGLAIADLTFTSSHMITVRVFIEQQVVGASVCWSSSESATGSTENPKSPKLRFFVVHPARTAHLSVGGEDIRVTLVKDGHGGATEELSAGGTELNL